MERTSIGDIQVPAFTCSDDIAVLANSIDNAQEIHAGYTSSIKYTTDMVIKLDIDALREEVDKAVVMFVDKYRAIIILVPLVLCLVIVLSSCIGSLCAHFLVKLCARYCCNRSKDNERWRRRRYSFTRCSSDDDDISEQMNPNYKLKKIYIH
ncbi:unnamed protein product [Mytilus coruscus]|uniref:Uncharacterized protein n=1 Tax=Mytilus coruscus TaxID=42192 RepID=A0A6J8DWE7_MYTCO|nr:unnamed protein product [Mytilus coruscus]